jgi:dTDP-4-amino-4,6-dideoxygalactose transaminase
MSDEIALTQLVIGDEEERLVLAVLRSGQLAQGPMVARLERDFAAMCGVRHAIALNSGTAALVAALQAAELRPGDEVVTTPFTFAATLNAILAVGATAVFADIDPDTFTIDPVQLSAAITERTRAVIPVHLYGQPAAMNDIAELAAARSLVIVEDAAQAHGALVGDRAVGSFGIGCFSLYATKNVSSGEGGMLTTDDDDLADRVRLLRNQGMRSRQQHEVAGYNYRLTDLQAAVAIPQLGRLAGANELRRGHAARLSAGLAGTTGIVTPAVGAGRTHVFHQYTIRVTGAARLDRDALAVRLLDRGIASAVYYPRVVFDHECYRDEPRVVPSPVPRASRAAREVLSLPVHPHLSVSDIDRIIDEVRTALRS